VAHRAVLLLGLALALGAVVATPAVAAAAEPECTRRAGEFTPAPALKTPVALTLDPDAQVVNFGGGRDQQEVDVVANMKPALPQSITPEQIDIDVPRRLRRVGDALTTVSARRPTFSLPRLNPARTRMAFVACVPGEGLEAGSYVGLVTIEGPEGVGPASLALTANAKDGGLFWLGSLVALVVAAILLVYKETQKTTTKWTPGFWLLEFAIPLAVAFGAMYTAYSQTAAWGSDGIASVITLVGTAFAAAGLRSLIVAART
jgi:hypothetical protein